MQKKVRVLVQSKRLARIRLGVATTDHAMSSYGLPVIVIDNTAHGPADVLLVDGSKLDTETREALKRAGFAVTSPKGS